MLLGIPFNNIVFDAGYTGSTCYWEDGKRTPNVLQCNFCYFLLSFSFWILGFWKQIQFKHSEESNARWWTNLGPNYCYRPCSYICSSTTICHWPGMLLSSKKWRLEDLNSVFPYLVQNQENIFAMKKDCWFFIKNSKPYFRLHWGNISPLWHRFILKLHMRSWKNNQLI